MVSLRHRFGFLRGLMSGGRARGLPLYANVDVTHRCNLACAYCRWHSRLLPETLLDGGLDLDLSPEAFRRFCEGARGTGTQTLQFVGAGEPLLHPEIATLVRTAKEHGYRVLLYSNGTTLDERSVRMLVEARLDVLRVTLGDTTSEQFDRKHPHVKPGLFPRILEGLARVTRVKREAGSAVPRLDLGVPIDRDLVADLDAIVGIAASTGCDGLWFSVVLDFGRDELAPFCLGPDEVERACDALRRARGRIERLSLAHNIDDVLVRYRLGKDVWKQAPCYSAWYFAFLRSDGRLTVCQRGQVPMGDLREQSFGEIWNGEAYREFRRRALTDPSPPYDCEFCPHAVNNHRVHRYARLVLPLLGRRRPPAGPGA